MARDGQGKECACPCRMRWLVVEVHKAAGQVGDVERKVHNTGQWLSQPAYPLSQRPDWSDSATIGLVCIVAMNAEWSIRCVGSGPSLSLPY